MNLSDQVAVVAGGSRGAGRGIAVALGELGATVIVTGRTTRDGVKPGDGAPGTIEDTAEEVTRRGGKGVAVQVDHTDPKQVEALFRKVGRVDVLACAVWGGNERYLDTSWAQPFWEQPEHGWNEAMDAGPYAFWLAARAAAGTMAEQSHGLIVVVSEPVLDSQESSTFITFRDLAHHSINRLVSTLADEAKRFGVAVIGLLPGFMRTERVQMHLTDEKAREESRYDLSESPEYLGRAVAALAADENVLVKTGKLLYVADLAVEYGFADVDGKLVGNFYREVLGLT